MIGLCRVGSSLVGRGDGHQAGAEAWHKLTVDSRSLREDRILHEVFATGGDARRICELFGLSVSAAMRYVGEHVEPGATGNGGAQSDDSSGRSTTSDPEAGHW